MQTHGQVELGFRCLFIMYIKDHVTNRKKHPTLLLIICILGVTKGDTNDNNIMFCVKGSYLIRKEGRFTTGLHRKN